LSILTPLFPSPLLPPEGKREAQGPVGQGCENDRTKPRLKGGASELENVTITTLPLVYGKTEISEPIDPESSSGPDSG
jgi:hypothetical protein